MNLLPSLYKSDALPDELHATYDDVLPQLLHDLLDHIIQHAKYLSPAGYSVMLHDPCDPAVSDSPTDH